jgi:hypothetical protein
MIRREKYPEAEARLTEIMNDRGAGEWRERAQLLRNFVAFKMHREERLHELALELMSPNAEKTIGQNLVDYSYAQLGELGHKDDLGDWIETFQSGQGPHALEKWRETKSLPWLVAALHFARPADDAVGELLTAAREVPAKSPGYVMVSYHMVRLLPADEARSKADALLKVTESISDRNLFLKERLRLARNLDEFYRFAPREAAGSDNGFGALLEDVAGKYLDTDSGDVLNRGVPLSVLRDAAKNPRLPVNVREELGRVVMARELVLSADPPFDGVFTILRTPGISPWVRDGFGRLSGYGFERDKNVPTKMSYLRDNWWAALKDPPPVLAFPLITEEQRRQAAKEWEKLRVAPAAATWLGMHTVAFATAHPDDPRVPEALHLVVEVSHYSAGTDERSGEYSRRAFNLLHRRYPTSGWTKKTPYWYE